MNALAGAGPGPTTTTTANTNKTVTAGSGGGADTKQPTSSTTTTAGMTIWCDPHASNAVGARPALIICDRMFHNLQRLEIGSGADSSDSALSLFAGKIGTAGDTDGSRFDARFRYPDLVCRNPRDGSLFVIEPVPQRVRKVSGGLVSTFYRASYQLDGGVCTSDGAALLICNSTANRIESVDTVSGVSRVLPWSVEANLSTRTDSTNTNTGTGTHHSTKRLVSVRGRTTAVPDTVCYVIGEEEPINSYKFGVWRFDIPKQRLTRVRASALVGGTCPPELLPGEVPGPVIVPFCQAASDQWLVQPMTRMFSLFRADLNPSAAATAAAATAGIEPVDRISVQPELLAGENKLARSIERASDGLAIGEAGFGMIAFALVSTQYEPDQRPCLYVADPIFHAIRRITLPAHWNVLPDL